DFLRRPQDCNGSTKDGGRKEVAPWDGHQEPGATDARERSTRLSNSKKKSIAVGVLGFQGDIEENVAATKQALHEMNVDGDVELVRYPEEVERVDGLILPGGESTVQITLAAIQRLLPLIKKRISDGMPVLGTCAGMIILSHRAFDRVVGDTKQKLIGNLDIVIERNAFGRQGESFEADIAIGMLGKEAFKG